MVPRVDSNLVDALCVAKVVQTKSTAKQKVKRFWWNRILFLCYAVRSFILVCLLLLFKLITLRFQQGLVVAVPYQQQDKEKKKYNFSRTLAQMK